MSAHHGSCHCGAITLTMDDQPTEAATCNCSICRRSGALWHYPRPDQACVEGQGAGYVHGDRTLTLWHCPACGCITHWTAFDPEYPRMGVNLRMFEPALWEWLPRRLIDGASY